MRDGVFVAKAGVPAVAILTEEFVTQGEFVARAVSMPSVPRVVIEHPVAGTGHDNMVRVANAAVPELIAALSGDRG